MTLKITKKSIIVPFVIISLFSIVIILAASTPQLPPAKSTYDPSYGLFPHGYLDSAYEGIPLTQGDIQKHIPVASINLLPSNYQCIARLYNATLNQYYIIISPQPLSDFKMKTIYENGCIVVHISTSVDVLNHATPTEDAALKKFVKDLAEGSSVGEIFRVGTGELFGYGYIGHRTAWGEQGITLILNNGIFIWIQACLPEEWIRAMANNLSILPQT